MKFLISFLFTSLLLGFTLTGCGGDVSDDEVIETFETTFSVESTAANASESRSASSFQGNGGSDTSSYSDSRASTPSGNGEAASRERTTENTSSSSETVDVPPEVQRIAGNVVSSLQAGDFGSAVHALDLLMNEPGLSIEQRRAVRNTMAAVQRKLATDPNISDQQKQRAREVLAR